MAQEYISQVFEEIERRVTKKLSKEFSRREFRILGALSKLEFLMEPQVRACSVAVPAKTRNSNTENQEPNEDRSPNDPCPKAMVPSHRSGILNNSEMEELPHMVTRAQEEIRNRHHMIQEEISYCCPGSSSGKQKKARFISQPHFRCENTPVTIEADQILLSLQQLATSNNSANFNKNISRTSKLPKSLKTKKPTFDGK